MKLTIDARHISLDEIVAAERVEISKSNIFTTAIERAHNFLINEIEKGKPIYGITTGYGSSGKNYVAYEDAARLQQNLFRFHGCGIGKNLSPKVCRHTVLIRAISLSKGRSAVSMDLLRRFELLLRYDDSIIFHATHHRMLLPFHYSSIVREYLPDIHQQSHHVRIISSQGTFVHQGVLL